MGEGGICTRPNDFVPFLKAVDKATLICVSSFILITALITVYVTVYIYCKRTAEQRPLFVSLQMLFLNLFWIFLGMYYASIITRVVRGN